MDFRLSFLGFCVLIQMVTHTVSVVPSPQATKDCRLCKPGYYVSRQCTGSHDTVCKPCSKGTFSPVYNVFEKCTKCSMCDVGEFVLTECTKYSDTVCESCSAVSDVISDTFAKECLQNQNDVTGRESRVINPNDVMLQDGNVDTHNEFKTYNVVYEGSGTPIIEEIDVWPTVEGSGVSTVEETIENVTYAILPEGIEAEVTDTTTTKTGVIDIEGGIKLNNVTEKQGKEIVLSTIRPDVSTTTIPAIILDGGDGVLLHNEPTPETAEVDVSLTDTESPKARASKDDKLQSAAKTPDNFSNPISRRKTIAKYNFEESGTRYYGNTHIKSVIVLDHIFEYWEKTVTQLGESEESGGNGIGVIVTVGLVAALVFFILGFLVSRYWSSRRERTFNVMEAERRNGKTPVECIDYRDPENNGRSKPNVYDEMHTDAKTNGRTDGAGADPVYSKPVTRAQAQTTNAAPPQRNSGQDKRGGEWAGFSISRNSSSGSIILQLQGDNQQQKDQTPQRPVSEIKYIDEEQETDRLLPASANGSDVSGPRSVTSSESGNSRGEPDLSDESVPMLSRGGPNSAVDTSS